MRELCERPTGERWSEGHREGSQTAPGSCSPPSVSAERQSSRDTRTDTGIPLQPPGETAAGGGE